MFLFIHGCVNLCDVMRCGTLSSMIRWHPLLKNVHTSFMLLHVVKLLMMVSDRSLITHLFDFEYICLTPHEDVPICLFVSSCSDVVDVDDRVVADAWDRC